MIILETDRLILRMLRESDIDVFAEMCGDPEVMRYIGDGQPLEPTYGVAKNGNDGRSLDIARLRTLGSSR
jgi:RimJ/RimL family protein N-acetyltransferase